MLTQHTSHGLYDVRYFLNQIEIELLIELRQKCLQKNTENVDLTDESDIPDTQMYQTFSSIPKPLNQNPPNKKYQKYEDDIDNLIKTRSKDFYNNISDILSSIQPWYVDNVLPYVSEVEGWSGHCDVLLELMKQRIKLGILVAEAKLASPSKQVFQSAVLAGDKKSILKEITDTEVEKVVLERIQKRAAEYLPESCLITPFLVTDWFERVIIPKTKDVEVVYIIDVLQSREVYE